MPLSLTIAKPLRASNPARAAFTLIEVLVATLFMVIVIPVALSGVRVAASAGEASQRKLVAARVANKVINELRAENQLQNGSQHGVFREDSVDYTWSQQTAFWTGDPSSQMFMATVVVEYKVAGARCTFNLSTLIPPAN
jgi:type II secretory pathway pseudopilin PulG